MKNILIFAVIVLTFIVTTSLKIPASQKGALEIPEKIPKEILGKNTVENNGTTGTTTTPVNNPVNNIATTTENKKLSTSTKEISKKQEKKVVAISTPKIVEPTPDFESINTFTRLATVNIICTSKGGELSPVSGTGVIIGSQGIILTNAHIGQYFLLRDWKQKNFIECVIRTGSPAYPKYHAELVFISLLWVENNKTILKQQNPQGTGENDFAFLRITENIDGSLLSSSFPYVPANIREVINVGEPVVLVSYPAGFLGGMSILQGLNITSAVTTIQDIFTFKETTIDLVSVGGTVVSQKGASGGAVVDRHFSVIGIISTSSEGGTTKDRDLRAITLSYINRDLQNEIGINLPAFLSQDLADFAKTFATTTAPKLTKLITDELNK